MEAKKLLTLLRVDVVKSASGEDGRSPSSSSVSIEINTEEEVFAVLAAATAAAAANAASARRKEEEEANSSS